MIPPKWNPLLMPEAPPRDKNEPASDDKDNKDTTSFEPNFITTGTLADIFRIFTEGDICNELPDLGRIQAATHPNDHLEVATDGSCMAGTVSVRYKAVVP